MSSKQTKKATKETKVVEQPKKAEPVVEAPKKGGAKKVAEKKVTAPKKAEPVVKEVAPQKATKTAVIKPVEKAVEKAVIKPVEKAVEKAVEKSAEKPAKKQVKKATKKAAKKTATKEVAPKVETAGRRTRYFKVFVDGEEAPHGRFSGAKPKQAANKALTSLAKALEQNGAVAGKINFSIVECTRGSKHKRYEYTGERVKLDTPMRVQIGSGPDAKEIVYKYSTRVMKAKTA